MHDPADNLNRDAIRQILAELDAEYANDLLFQSPDDQEALDAIDAHFYGEDR